MTHTPTPWKSTKCTNGDIYIGGHEWVLKIVDKVDFTTMPKEANAAFIATACNAHYPLLKSLKAIRGAIASMPEISNQFVLDHMDAAIALAEVKAS